MGSLRARLKVKMLFATCINVELKNEIKNIIVERTKRARELTWNLNTQCDYVARRLDVLVLGLTVFPICWMKNYKYLEKFHHIEYSFYSYSLCICTMIGVDQLNEPNIIVDVFFVYCDIFSWPYDSEHKLLGCFISLFFSSASIWNSGRPNRVHFIFDFWLLAAWFWFCITSVSLFLRSRPTGM